MKTQEQKNLANKVWKKYRYLGYSYPSVPSGWLDLTIKAIEDIDKLAKPKWLPRFMCNWIHYLATGNSVVRIKYIWAHNIRQKLFPYIIFDIKSKFGGLRMYLHGTEEMQDIAEKAEDLSYKVCEDCGSTYGVKQSNGNWIYTLCKKHLKELNKI